MEEEAQKRKERLEGMRKRKKGDSTGQSVLDAEKKISFRSYQPTDEKLQSMAKIATPTDITGTIESETKDVAKETIEKAEEKDAEEVDLYNLAPKKKNYDLRRLVEERLEKLDKSTGVAIATLIKNRLAEQAENGEQ